MFKNITERNSLIRSSIKELVYDPCIFDRKTKAGYCDLVIKEIRNSTKAWRNLATTFEFPKRLNELILAVDGSLSDDDLYPLFGNDPIIEAGYDLLQELARDGACMVRQGKYELELCMGLRKLPRMRTVRLMRRYGVARGITWLSLCRTQRPKFRKL